MKQIVIVGAGQGGLQVAASLRDNGFEGRVLLVGNESGLPYQRPPLSKAYLTGKVSDEQLALRPEGFFTNHRIDLLTGEHVESIDRQARHVILRSGAHLDYDHLILAVGARNRSLSVPGGDLEGVRSIRTQSDAEAVRQSLCTARSVIIIGGGFIGLELAVIAHGLGAEVHVLEVAPRVMARAVSVEMSTFFADAHTRRGIRIHFGASVQRIDHQNGRISAVEADGIRYPADLVLFGIGIEPNIELARDAGLTVGGGIVVNDHLLTDDASISAIGDCAVHPNPFADRLILLESVQNAVDQARCVGARLTGRPQPYTSVPWFWTVQADLKLQMVGLVQGHDHTVIRGNRETGSFSVFCFTGERLLGIESVNRPGDHMAGRRILAAGARLTPQEAGDEAFSLKALADKAPQSAFA